MSASMSNELEAWLDEWSAKLDSVEAGLEKEVFKIDLFEKFASFVMKISSFPTKHFYIAEDEGVEEE
jgi:hypothetical protein